MSKPAKKRIGVLVVAYNAATTLAKTLDRIPDGVRGDIEEVIVSDDHSQDSTYLVGLGYQQVSELPITLIRQPKNLGYGGNQKAGYNLAIEHGLDIVVMLHGDGQYAPESMPDLLEPLLDGEADAVFGSRIMIKGAARKGGMPLYKYVGNRILSPFENAALGTDLTEFHSGYRAYSVDALKRIPFEQNTDGFNFDTQIIIQLHDAGMRIAEVPIPTYYGDEICYVDGMGYAADVTKDVVSYRLQKAGFGDGSRISLNEEYQLKPSEDSSHGRISTMMAARPPAKILDLGCSSGQLAERLQEMGHHVTGRRRARVPRGGRADERLLQGRPHRGDPARGRHRIRPRADGRRARASRQAGRAARDSARTSSPPKGRSCCACPTSATGTRGPGRRSECSTTTSGASSTPPTCGSSPAGASAGWSSAAATPYAAWSRWACRSTRSGSRAPGPRRPPARPLPGHRVADDVRLPVHPRGHAQPLLTGSRREPATPTERSPNELSGPCADLPSPWASFRVPIKALPVGSWYWPRPGNSQATMRSFPATPPATGTPSTCRDRRAGVGRDRLRPRQIHPDAGCDRRHEPSRRDCVVGLSLPGWSWSGGSRW